MGFLNTSMNMKSFRQSWIIHIFALLHAIVALICRLTGTDDQILLTVLTMAMALTICMKAGLKVEFTTAVVIVVNILGYIIGNLGAGALQSLISSEYAVHCLSTIITTEILGWSIFGLTKILGQKEEGPKDFRSSPYMKWIILTASGIFVLRLLIIIFMSRSTFEQDLIFEIIRKIMTNTFALIMLVCINVLFIRSLKSRDSNASRLSTTVIYLTFMLLATLLVTFLVGLTGEKFMMLFMISFIVQITMYCIIYMIHKAITTRIEMQAEREKANMAQYRYLKLKRQVNPHFLFNSLNILDCLICEEQTEKASTYTHKLAGIYRYMIKSEDEEVVSLRDELVFVQLYIDLLKVRFPEGFDVIIDVPEEKMARFVPPCSIQLLIENATKHNAVSAETPLVVHVKAEEEQVMVSNNIVPKVTRSQSTGLGQKYIRQLYMDMSGKSIEIRHTEKEYCVILPLL